MRLVVSLLGLEVFAISTDSTSLTETESLPEGDSTSYPMGFTAHMERPHESQTPDRDW